MTAPTTDVVAVLAALSGLDVPQEELPALAEALANQARRFEPLLDLDLTEVDAPPSFDARWTADGESGEIVNDGQS
jgi:hypothetical protein